MADHGIGNHPPKINPMSGGAHRTQWRATTLMAGIVADADTIAGSYELRQVRIKAMAWKRCRLDAVSRANRERQAQRFLAGSGIILDSHV